MILRRKRRPILATMLVLAFAIFAYLHAVPATIDLADMQYRSDPEHPLVTDLPIEIRNLDGQRVAVDGWLIAMVEADHTRRMGIVPIGFSPLPWSPTQLIGNNWSPAPLINRNIHVVGRLHIHADIVEGYVVSLDEIDVEQVVPIYSGDTAKWPWAVIGVGIAVVSAVPLLRRALIRRRLRRAGHCIRCGYDLRATPTRCPECGLEAPTGNEPAITLPG